MLKWPFVLLWNFLKNSFSLPFRLVRRCLPLPKEMFAHIEIQKEYLRWKQPPSFLHFFRKKEADRTQKQWDLLFQQIQKMPQIKKILLEVHELDCTWTELDELRQSLLRFRGTNQTVFLFTPRLGNAEYYLSTAVDRLIVPPFSEVSLTMPSLSMPFLGDFLQKWGVEPHFIRVGKHKNAPESMFRSFPSPTNRKDLEKLLQEHRNMLFAPVAEEKRESIQTLFQKGIFSIEEALQHQIVDGIRFRERMEDYLLQKEPVPYEYPEKPDFIEAEDVNLPLESHPTEKAKNKATTPFLPISSILAKKPALWVPPQLFKPTKIAVIPIVGTIQDSSQGRNPKAVREFVVKALQKVAENDRYKAAVVYIDSRGGSGHASEAIWQAVRELETSKPTLSYLDSYAASGGYYIACGASKIVAHPLCITGSIGVFGGIFVIQSLLEKLNVSWVSVGASEGSSLFSPFQKPNAEQTERIQQMMLDFYHRFLARVGNARKMSQEEVHQRGQGQVFFAHQAQQMGLVDEIATFPQMIQNFEKQLGLSKSALEIVSTEGSGSWLEQAQQFTQMQLNPPVLDKLLSLPELESLYGMLQEQHTLLWQPPLWNLSGKPFSF